MRALGVIAALAAVALPGAACGQSSSPATQQREQLRMRSFVSGLDSPVYVTAPRSQPGKLYIVEQSGVIRVVVNSHSHLTGSHLEGHAHESHAQAAPHPAAHPGLPALRHA